MKNALAMVALAGLLLPAGFSHAQDRGRMLALSCAACHGTGGVSPGAIPSLKGKSARYLIERLQAFRDDRRPSTVMNRLARGYTDAEIEAMARYFSRLE